MTSDLLRSCSSKAMAPGVRLVVVTPARIIRLKGEARTGLTPGGTCHKADIQSWQSNSGVKRIGSAPKEFAIQPAINALQISALLTTVVSMAVAMGLGALIGLERQARQRTAGLRTNTLVSVGAALFVDLAHRLNGFPASVHVLAYVVSGVGFLGAGAIMKEGLTITGLNTAATLWCSAAVGACAGAQQLGIAGVGALSVLMINTLLRPVAKRIGRQPMLDAPTEAAYLIQVFVISDAAAHGVILKRLVSWLHAIGCESRDIDYESFGHDRVLIQVTLISSTVLADELNKVTARASTLPGVAHAYWVVSGDE